MIKYSPEIRQLLSAFQEKGLEVHVNQVEDPAGLDALISAAPSYTFRLATPSEDSLVTQRIVRFLPESGELLELLDASGLETRPLVFDYKLLEKFPVDCLGGAEE